MQQQRFLGNAIASGMLPEGVFVKRYITLDKAKELVQSGFFVSCVGHENTAGLFSTLLEYPVEMNRVNITLNPGDRVLVGEYSGPRLPEGATSLPDGATIKWCLYKFCTELVPDAEVNAMGSMITDAQWGYYDHHTGVDTDEYLDSMSKMCNKAVKLLHAMFC